MSVPRIASILPAMGRSFVRFHCSVKAGWSRHWLWRPRARSWSEGEVVGRAVAERTWLAVKLRLDAALRQ
jgi:hypothetical protein